jgi:protocatechuate 3,4-dioxygenase beta subunit
VKSEKSVAASGKQKPAEATAESGVTAPINVSGRAIDTEGKPIAGAKIYIASVRVDWKRIGETTTDASGRYFFRNARLPIERPDTNRGQTNGAFLIYGQAAGHGFAWRPTKWYYPQRNLNTYVGLPGDDEPHVFQANDKIELDLHFAPSTTVRGRIVDDRGKPIANTKLAIWDCERVPSNGYRTKSDALSEPAFNVFDRNGFELLNADVPPEMRIRRTDATGRFKFTGLPAGCRFRVSVNPPGFAGRMVWIATQAGLRKEYDGTPLYDGLEEFEIRFAASSNVPIQVLYGDTGKPAVRVWVELFAKNASAYKTTDAAGRTQLGVPAGEYKLNLLPAYKTPYLETESTFKVDADSPLTERIVKLRPAAEVEIRVLDQETGRGVPNVDLWHATKGGGREEYYSTSWEVATHIVHRDRERTDKNGVIQEFFEPGKHRIGVALEAFPKGYAPIEPDGREIDFQPGKPIFVEFRMRRTAGTPADR